MIETETPKADHLRVFLCHTSADKAVVRHLYRRLKADGFKPWLDEEDILPGQNWQEEIPKAVRASDVVLVCLSQNSITREGYVQKEIRFALDIAEEKPPGTIFIIPVRLEAVDVPARLMQWQWANFFQQDGYERLVRALRIRASAVGLNIRPVRRQLPFTPRQPEVTALPVSSRWLSQFASWIKTFVIRMKKLLPVGLVDMALAACIGGCWAAAFYIVDLSYRFIGYKIWIEVQLALYGIFCGLVLALLLWRRIRKMHWKNMALIALAWCLALCVSDTFWFRISFFLLRHMGGTRPARMAILRLVNAFPFVIAGAFTGVSVLDTQNRRRIHFLVGALSFGLAAVIEAQFMHAFNYDFPLYHFGEGAVGTWLLFLFIRLLAAYDAAPASSRNKYGYVTLAVAVIVSPIIAISYTLLNGVEATYFKGWDYYSGKGVTQDYVQAKRYFEKAAANGHVSAMIELGGLYENGQGVAQDYDQARRWYEKAAEAGEAYSSPRAMYQLGILYVNGGHGIDKDYEKAFEWFWKSADGGNTDAMNYIGVLYWRGQGAPQDYEQARNWFLKAAAKDHTLAMENLGRLYENGFRVNQDYQRARQWYELAAANGDGSAMRSLGRIYQYGRGVTQDYHQARHWYEKAAAAGDEEAKKRLAELPQ